MLTGRFVCKVQTNRIGSFSYFAEFLVSVSVQFCSMEYLWDFAGVWWSGERVFWRNASADGCFVQRR
jgi:hypothetical protein